MKKSFLLAVSVICSAPAFAADMPVKARPAPVPYVQYNDILIANNQISVSAVLTHLNYAEFDDGRFGDLPPGTFVDSEKGWVPGVGVKGSAMGNWVVDNLYVAAEASWSKGRTEYMQGPALGVIFQNHDAEFADVAFRLGKGFALQPNFMVTPFAEYGYHQWIRRVNFGEVYRHQYAGGGLLLQYAPVQRLVLSLSGMVGSTFDAQIDIAAIPNNNPDVNGLGLGSALTWRVGGAADYAITPNFHILGGIDYTEFKYGASVTVPALGPGYEPDSTSKVFVAKLGVGYSWGAPAIAVVAKY
jgi:hypothetical protein